MSSESAGAAQWIAPATRRRPLNEKKGIDEQNHVENFSVRFAQDLQRFCLLFGNQVSQK